MGFNKCFLPKINMLEEELNRIGLMNFVNRYKKYDSVIGETDSVRFFDSKIKQYHDLTSQLNDIVNRHNVKDSGDGRVPS
jgi:hypothetical protein